MKKPGRINLPDAYIRFIIERGGVMSIFHGATVFG
jgi:hypothetical protein